MRDISIIRRKRSGGIQRLLILTIAAMFSIAAALGINFESHTEARTRDRLVTNRLGGSDVVQRLAMTANDVIYDKKDKMIYASRPSTVGTAEGNSLTRIDPVSARVLSSTFIGSEPNKLAISDDAS